MTNTIRFIYKNDEGEQYTVNAPLLKEKDVQLVFKSVNIQIDDTILFDNYYYSYCQYITKYTCLKKDDKGYIIDVSDTSIGYETELSLKTDVKHENIQSTIVIEHDDYFDIYSSLRKEYDTFLDLSFIKNSIMRSKNNQQLSDDYNHMSYDKYCIVSTCVNGQEAHFIHPKNGLFYIPGKIKYFHPNNNKDLKISRIENIEKHICIVGDIVKENSIDTIDISFEQYEFLEEKIQESLNRINTNVNMINDNTIKDKDNYLEEISTLSSDLSPIINLTEQWRKIMLAY